MRALKHAIGVCLMAFSSLVSAAVVPPWLNIQSLGSDAGGVLTATTFDITASVIDIDTGSGLFDINPNATFTLTSAGSYDGNVGTFDGAFSIDGGLLSGTFTALSVVGLGGGDASFSGDLLYSSGSLMGGLSGGRIEGILLSPNEIIANLGPVVVPEAVPVPAAVWLFGSGLIGLAGFARRGGRGR